MKPRTRKIVANKQPPHCPAPLSAPKIAGLQLAVDFRRQWFLIGQLIFK
jgi:hypothetical protein